jgi:hypothetical protein
MSSSTLRRLIVVLTLGALLGIPATSRAGSSPTVRHPRSLEAVQTPLSRLWSFLVGPWEKEGHRIDPNGRSVRGSRASKEAGCSGGLCGRPLASAQESLDNGCGQDPYGRCLPGHE